MGKLGLSLTGSYLGYQVQNLFGGAGKKEERRKAFQHTASRKIRAELQSLKGAVMKIGQALSMQTHLLPFEATEELANLQMRAPAMHATLARARFKSSLGKYPEEVFKEFAPEPLAAASLGQVHRAVTKDGQIVAVKIQYPAIRTAIENDFKLLRSATLPTQFSGHSPSAVIEELERGILKETDYLNEARNLEFFGHALAPLPYVSVPRPLPEYSTDRVLTMTFLEGGTVDEYLHANPSQKQRDLLGYRLVELFHYQLRKVHALHSDPHPGNYLFDKEGHVALVDFGSVSHFSARMIEIIKCFTDKVWLRGDPGIQEMCHLVCGKQAKEAPQRARRTIDLTIEFYNTIFPGGPVNFGDGKIILILTKLWKEFLKNKLVNPDLIFASRAEMGMYNLLHRIGARVDTTEILNRVTKMKGPEK
ncbi:MAG TPA: AarF/ABC1/UbiB kinase family protein [Verrucomicrobiae bacterium]|nr:AarF/ABC1/UbiB kinase family protein [Verrucomicrobiae bacterium]